MRASDIAKLAAAIAAGSITYNAVVSQLDDDGDISLLDSILAGGAGSIAGAAAGKIMDATGVSDLIDEVFDW
jgi:hypothetical protein